MLGVTTGVWGATEEVIRLIKPAISEPAVPPGIMCGLSAAGGLGSKGGLDSGVAGAVLLWGVGA